MCGVVVWDSLTTMNFVLPVPPVSCPEKETRLKQLRRFRAPTISISDLAESVRVEEATSCNGEVQVDPNDLFPRHAGEGHVME